MFDSKCCICSTIKNCGKYLEKVLQNMDIIGSLFSDYKIIISYDKSHDNTLDIIKNTKKQIIIMHVV
jgi:hypothetical protein